MPERAGGRCSAAVPIQMLRSFYLVRELTFAGFPIHLSLFLRMELWVSPALGEWGEAGTLNWVSGGPSHVLHSKIRAGDVT